MNSSGYERKETDGMPVIRFTASMVLFPMRQHEWGAAIKKAPPVSDEVLQWLKELTSMPRPFVEGAQIWMALHPSPDVDGYVIRYTIGMNWYTYMSPTMSREAALWLMQVIEKWLKDRGVLERNLGVF